MENTNNIKVATLSAGMNKDLDPAIIKSDSGVYTHMINGKLNSHDGNMLFVQNEPSTLQCIALPYDIIGSAKLSNGRHVVFLTDDFNSEIGIFDTNSCKYTKVVNSRCLNFKKEHLVKAVTKENFDCTESVYFTDGVNPRRVLNLNRVPYTYTLRQDATSACTTKVYTDQLDCREILLDRKFTYPSLSLSLGPSGTLRNGSYQVAIAYTINQQQVTDWLSITTPQPIFSHENLGKSLEVDITGLDSSFEEFAVLVIYTVNQTTTAEIVGYFPAEQSRVVISKVGNNAVANPYVPLSELVISRPYYEKATDVVTSGDYLLWSNPSTRTELNYQLQAMDIKSSWVSYKVPKDYYRKGGAKVGYQRDEVYAFYIQWLYDTGHWSPAYHIPGRESEGSDMVNAGGPDVFELRSDGCDEKRPYAKWEVTNTAKQSTAPVTKHSPCEEYIIAEGEMAYWQSTDLYPDNKNLYGENACKPIRHHKFPDSCVTHIHDNGGDGINILGVRFSNIQHPKDEKGNPISDIVGYRIIRADRTNDKSILAKGLIFNMGEYQMPAAAGTETVLYPNYPYNDLRVDPFLSATPVSGGTAQKGYSPLGTFRRDMFTFHSPSTSISRISLGNELKIETEEVATVEGHFEDVFKHPRHKLIKDFALLMSAALGVGEGLMSLKGKRTTTVEDPTYFNPGLQLVGVTNTTPGGAATAVSDYTTYIAAEYAKEGINLVSGNLSNIVSSFLPGSKIPDPTELPKASLAGISGFILHGKKVTVEDTANDFAPSVLGVTQKAITFGYYFAQGTSTILNVIKAFVPYFQYAKQYVSRGDYNKYYCSRVGNKRRGIQHYEYLYPSMQQVENIKVNNFKRESSVVLRLNEPIQDPVTIDNTRQTIKTANKCDNPNSPFFTTASSYYASVKRRVTNQYGQIDSPSLLSTGQVFKIDSEQEIYTSDVVFGGDTYINKFTVKRKMHYFNQFEFAEMDGHEFDYRKYYNIPYAKFWMNSTEYEVTDLLTLQLPNDRHSLDCRKPGSISLKDLSQAFVVKNAYFYLFNCGVVDFYVESEYNLDYRDYEDTLQGRHYDQFEYTNLSDMFRSDVVEMDNRYLYDKSLSKQLTENFIQIQSRDFDPAVASTCYTKFPNRVLYSLPSYKENKQDNWRAYLANNYYDFPKSVGALTGMRFIERSGILFFFDKSAPFLHRTIDTLQTDSSLKVTIGDGGLFTTPPQQVAITDYGYGSCQSRFAFTQTEFGLIYPSQTTGNVFLYTGKLQSIADKGMSSWLNENLPSRLLKQFPDFPYKDNPVIGVGLLSTYDSSDSTYYLTKRDYKVRDAFINDFKYDHALGKFTYSGIPIALGDPNFFDDASWTLSYNFKTQSWISFHDWKPDWVLQTDNHFISSKQGILWKHNEVCNSFCVFYGEKRPFEIEYVIPNGVSTDVLRSIEYTMDAYKYFNDCHDFHNLLDFNFDQAVIHNIEQASGVLRLNIQPKNKLRAQSEYPILTPSFIDILYSKEEGKYRFNQFWDAVKDRSEFNDTYKPIWYTLANGYERILNTSNIDYGKPLRYRKKFRSTWHKVVLRRMESDDVKMIFKFGLNKQVKSPR